MNIIIRLCAAEDTIFIHRLNKYEMGYDFPLTETEKQLLDIISRGTDRIFVAESDGEVIGYVHACDYQLLYSEPMKNIMGIAVDSRYKRRGVGSMLLKAVEDWAARSGAQAVRLTSGEERAEAHEFYKACGYCCGKKQLNFRKTV